MISNLHYISQGKSPEGHLENIDRMCRAGADWVQLRLKGESISTVLETAKAARVICNNYQVKLIINDYAEIAKKVNADGVHLGKEDSCPLEARKLLGANKIIGGTANTLEDCQELYNKQVDYIGLGPFRYTSTKKNLSPILGLSGYQKLLSCFYTHGKSISVIAIGGITPNDLPGLAKCGIHGVAVSGWLTNQKQPEEMLQQIIQEFSEN